MNSYITDKKNYSIADLHLHSRFAISTSPDLTPGGLIEQMKVKGIDIIGTGDIFHSQWREEMAPFVDKTSIIPTTEISLHFSVGTKKAAIHLVLVFSSLENADIIAQVLSEFAPVDRLARPDIFMSPDAFCQTIKENDEKCAIIPAHIFTPYFGGLGARGLTSLSVFGNHVKAVETGISADIEMCTSVKALEGYAYVSFSDAHSLQTLGREATIINKKGEVCAEILKPVATIECHPELGKYHFTGHKPCGYSRAEPGTDLKCPVCGHKMKRGVFERIADLEPSSQQNLPQSVKIAPLIEVLRCVQNTAGKTAKQEKLYWKAIESIGNEYYILLLADENELSKCFDEKTINAIIKLRTGKAKIKPGYDGVYGILEQ